MSAGLLNAAEVKAPKEGGAFAAAVTSTAASVDITTLRGRYITFQAQDAAVFLAFGDSSVTVDDTATATPASTDDTVGVMIPANQERSFYFHRNFKTGPNGIDNNLYVAYKTASGTATLRYWAS